MTITFWVATRALAFLERLDVVTLSIHCAKSGSRLPPGGREKRERLPAYHKRVSATLDSDDELMLDMREKGYSDRQIAQKLAKNGRVRYDQKSISTHTMRIRLAQAENFDFLLRKGYKEWEFEDVSRYPIHQLKVC